MACVQRRAAGLGGLYVGLEEVASAVDLYEPELMPGLLQTAAYARTVFRKNHPDVSEEAIARRVAVREGRQEVLRKAPNPLSCRAVVSESALHRPVGGHEVMAEQLRGLLERTRLPNLALRVVPVSRGLHAGMLAGGSFSILRFTDAVDPDTVYSEGFRGAVYLEAEADLTAYRALFDQLWDESLSVGDSRSLIEHTAKEFEG